METQLPLQKGAGPPMFGPFLLWPNAWMRQDATWYGGRPRPRRVCVKWGPNPLSENGRSPQFSAQVYCGQTATQIKMPLGTEVGLACLRDIVLHGDIAFPPLKGHSPQFSANDLYGQMADGLSCHLVRR